MAKTGKTVWDVIQVESRTLELGCKQGLFEKLDSTKIGTLCDIQRLCNAPAISHRVHHPG